MIGKKKQKQKKQFVDYTLKLFLYIRRMQMGHVFLLLCDCMGSATEMHIDSTGMVTRDPRTHAALHRGLSNHTETKQTDENALC